MIIGLSGKKHVGKTTVADYLHEKHDFAIGDFVKPIRIMIDSLLIYQGVSSERLAYLNGPGRDTEVVPELGWHTLRWAQQSLGHDWGRTLMHDRIWINTLENTNIFDNENIVFQNVRYQDEAHVVRSRDGYVIEILRPNGNDDDHPSENNLIRPDFKIINDTTPDNLFFKMSKILDIIKTNKHRRLI